MANKVQIVYKLTGILIVTLIFCFLASSFSYAAYTIEELEEKRITFKKDIETYTAQLEELVATKEETITNNEQLKQVEEANEKNRKSLEELLQKKEQLLSDARKQGGESAYAQQKASIDTYEARLKAEIKKGEKNVTAIRKAFEKQISSNIKTLKGNIEVRKKDLETVDTLIAQANKLEKDRRDAEPPADESIAGKFTVLGMPLDADYRLVMENMPSKNLYFKSPEYVIKSETQAIEKNKRIVKALYQKWNQPDKTEEALKIFDSGKYKIFKFAYNNNIMLLDSTSFPYFCKRNPPKYPMFVEDYNVYNSQFCVWIPSVSTDLNAAHVIGIEILFGRTVEKQAPQSFLFCLRFDGSDEVISALTKKYGEPKLYLAGFPRGCKDEKKKKLNKFNVDYLKKAYPNNEELPSWLEDTSAYNTRLDSFSKLVYGDLASALIPVDYLRTFVDDPFRVQFPYHGSSYCVLEWNKGDTKILLSCEILSDSMVVMGMNGTTIKPPTKIVLVPIAANYIYFPMLEKLSKRYKGMYFKSDEIANNIKEESMQGL